MDKKVLIALIFLLISICIILAFYYIFKPNVKPAPPPKSKAPPTQQTKPNPSGMAVLKSGYFIDTSGNELINDDRTFGAYITRVKSPTYTGPELVIAPYNPIPNFYNGLAVSKVEILNNGYLQFYKPDGTAPPEYTKVSGLNSYIKFDSSNVLSFYNGVNNLKVWDFNHGDYTYANPNGASRLTSGYYLDSTGNKLVSDDGSYTSKIQGVSGSYGIVTSCLTTVSNSDGQIHDKIPNIFRVEILPNGNMQFYNMVNYILVVTSVIVGGLNSYVKFDSSNVLSFYNSSNIKIWDMKHGVYA